MLISRKCQPQQVLYDGWFIGGCSGRFQDEYIFRLARDLLRQTDYLDSAHAVAPNRQAYRHGQHHV